MRPLGLKPALILETLRGAEAPLCHGATRIRVFLRSRFQPCRYGSTRMQALASGVSFPNRQSASNHNPIHPERSSRRSELWNSFGLYQRRILPPESLGIPLLAAAIEMQQICPVAGAVIREPLIGVGDAALMEQCQPIAGRFSLVGDDRGNQRLVDRRLIAPANLEPVRVHIPLHRVSEKMSEKKKPQLRRDRVVDVNFEPIEISSERIGNVTRDHANSVNLLQSLLYAG
jgi:hypothetical protein